MHPLAIMHVRRAALGTRSLQHIDISGPEIATLIAAGCTVEEVDDGPRELDAVDVLLVTGNAAWFPKLFHQLTGTPAELRPLIVIRHDEPLPPAPCSGLPKPRLSWREWARRLRRDPNATDCFRNARFLLQLAAASLPDILIVSSSSQRDYLAAHGVVSEFVPKGWRDSYGVDLKLPRSIDVLSLGSHQSTRRRRVIASLRSQGIDVEVVGNYFDPALYGSERTRLLNRARILLNIFRDPGLSMGHSRLTLGMANGCLVLSEPMHQPDPFVPGCHYVQATPEAMPEMIRFFLEHETERLAITETAHRFVRTQMTEAASTTRILALIRERLAIQKRSRAAIDRGYPLPVPNQP